jgi:3-methyladenine DNA glycosylase AlkD
MLTHIYSDTKKMQDPERAKLLKRFFKTGQGEYGEGDEFLGGITVPQLRALAKKYKDVELKELQELISDKYHEYRQMALFILVNKYKKAKQEIEKKDLVDFYLKNRKYVNNWDLVDCSAPYITGDYFFDKDKKILYGYVKSKELWEKRIAVLSTFGFIKNNSFEDALKIAEILLEDKHDLIHKAVGWMLREVGNKNKDLEKKFLDKHVKKMPRTMLRYAIEKFPEKERLYYLKL